MRTLLSVLLASLLFLTSCGGGDGGNATMLATSLIIQPDDGRAPLLQAIAAATNNIRLTIYAISDLQSVSQTPAAPAQSIAQALIDKAASGVSVRLIVDQNQYGSSSNAPAIQQTVAALRSAGVVVHLSSTAFCVTHQKTFVIDGPTSASPDLAGTAIIMSLNLMPGYFGGTRDYAVITRAPGVVAEISRVFDSDFTLANPRYACSYADTPRKTYTPPGASDTPALSEASLQWSPVNSKTKLLQLIAEATKSLDITTEEMSDIDMVCAIKTLAQSADKPSIRILLSGDTGSNGSAVKTLLGLNLPNLALRIMPGQPTPPGSTTIQTPLYMHGKQVIADGSQAFIGSENMTNTSLIQNRELGTLFTDPAMVDRLKAVFASDFEKPGNSLPAVVCSGTQNCATIPCP